MAVDDAFDARHREVAFQTDITQCTVDQFPQNPMLVSLGMGTLRVIPLTTLGRGRAFVAMGTLKTFGLDPNPNRPVKNRQMPQGNRVVPDANAWY